MIVPGLGIPAPFIFRILRPECLPGGVSLCPVSWVESVQLHP